MTRRKGGAVLESLRGVYPAPRAAALAGVPVSTLYYWARKGIYVPSVSPEKEKRWSFSDLLSLRAIYWLRRDKPDIEIARMSMRHVRQALEEARRIRIPFSTLDILVDQKGTFFYRRPDAEGLYGLGGQTVSEQILKHLNLLAAFSTTERLGPDLRQPRPHLRILPGKLGGEPHIAGTRITTAQLVVLRDKGFSQGGIVELYPILRDQGTAIEEAVSLERQLAENLRHAAA